MPTFAGLHVSCLQRGPYHEMECRGVPSGTSQPCGGCVSKGCCADRFVCQPLTNIVHTVMACSAHRLSRRCFQKGLGLLQAIKLRSSVSCTCRNFCVLCHSSTCVRIDICTPPVAKGTGQIVIRKRAEQTCGCLGLDTSGAPMHSHVLVCFILQSTSFTPATCLACTSFLS